MFVSEMPSRAYTIKFALHANWPMELYVAFNLVKIGRQSFRLLILKMLKSLENSNDLHW